TMIRDDRYKLSVYHGHDLGELFDLRTDPGEFNNLWDAPDYAGIKADLMKRSFDAMALAVDVGLEATGGYLDRSSEPNPHAQLEAPGGVLVDVARQEGETGPHNDLPRQAHYHPGAQEQRPLGAVRMDLLKLIGKDRLVVLVTVDDWPETAALPLVLESQPTAGIDGETISSP
ncbi:MAG: DUF4976 domain-containing protein, partial [bacterium]|nr:DUF4976 domain-containing protein [bacterium]